MNQKKGFLQLIQNGKILAQRQGDESNIPYLEEKVWNVTEDRKIIFVPTSDLIHLDKFMKPLNKNDIINLHDDHNFERISKEPNLPPLWTGTALEFENLNLEEITMATDGYWNAYSKKEWVGTSEY